MSTQATMDACLEVNKEVLKAAVLESTKAVEDAEGPPFVVMEIDVKENDNSPSQVMIVAFPGLQSPNDWFTGVGEAKPFGETKINGEKFPSLRSLGNNELAMVNAAFQKRFLELLKDNDGAFCKKVEQAVEYKKQIIFAGHSSGGPIAIYATVWFLEKYGRQEWFLEKYRRQEGSLRPLCLTFGSPITTDRTFCHAIRREGWSDCFVHFVLKLDIVPRILLAPLSSTRESLEKIIPFFNPNLELDSIDKEKMVSLYKDVMKNASCVANYAACEITGSKHSLSDTMSRFIKLSPYRPCGKYVFCTEAGRSVVVENPDAVLQLLYYSLQIEPKTELQEKAEPKTELQKKAELQEKAEASLNAHRTYKVALDESLNSTPHVVCSTSLRELPLSSNDAALNDLNLCAPARLCLRAAGELEKKKMDNQVRVDRKKEEIVKDLEALERYREASKEDGRGYYDAFKLHEKEGDFKANVMRLELTAIWSEIYQMVRQRELPDGFEMRGEWVELGTRFRHLMEPIDIANYYRHGREAGSGAYLGNGRPRPYLYTQRWREHADQLPKDPRSESEQSRDYCESSFWAEVEELKPKAWKDVEAKVLALGERLEEWCTKKEVGSDVFLEKSTFTEWWQTLRKNHPELRTLPPEPMPLAE